MSLAWFVCPYKRRDSGGSPGRYVAMDDFTPQIFADGGNWAETEILGDSALVKVNASDATLTNINAAPGFIRIPNHVNLDDTLGDLTNAQKNAIINKALSLGYTQAEIDAALPTNWASLTLLQLLKFLATRRFKPRFDAPTNTIVLDGPTQPVTRVEDVAASVQ